MSCVPFEQLLRAGNAQLHFYAILVGESGSGKTTIGRAIVRINPCSKGAIYFKGSASPVRSDAKRIARSSARSRRSSRIPLLP